MNRLGGVCGCAGERCERGQRFADLRSAKPTSAFNLTYELLPYVQGGASLRTFRFTGKRERIRNYTVAK